MINIIENLRKNFQVYLFSEYIGILFLVCISLKLSECKIALPRLHQYTNAKQRLLGFTTWLQED
jgi:hypothetical protein